MLCISVLQLYQMPVNVILALLTALREAYPDSCWMSSAPSSTGAEGTYKHSAQDYVYNDEKKKRKINPWRYWKALTEKYCGELLLICTQFRPKIVVTSLNITWICVISISVLLNNSVSMHSYHRKSKCDINSLKFYLAVK